MELPERILTLRRSVALSRLPHVHYVRLRGDGAHELLDRVFTRELYVRDGQLSLGLLLREDGSVLADCYLGSDEDAFFLLAECPDRAELVEYLRIHGEGAGALEIVGTDEYALIGVEGPYAWELMARLGGPEIIGLPFMTFFHLDGMICCRAGKTGEYGYWLIVPSDRAGPVWDELSEKGRALDVGEAGLEALDVCALENWFFNVRREGSGDLTPLELQLQWRLSRGKTFVGSDALIERRRLGLRRRVTTVAAPGPMSLGDRLVRDGRSIGEVVNAAFSPARGDWIGLALVELEYAHPGVTASLSGAADISARFISTPVIANRSLYVNPQVHSYASRHEDDFPSLVPA